MLNQTNIHHRTFSGGRPPAGVRFFNTGVTIVNEPNHPIRTWIVDDGVNPVVAVQSPDLGLLLHPSLVLDPSYPPVPPPVAVPRAFFAEQFKVPSLWGVKDTARYFHDNGAKTLRDGVAHYQRFFNFTEVRTRLVRRPGRIRHADRRRR